MEVRGAGYKVDKWFKGRCGGGGGHHTATRPGHNGGLW